MLEGTPTLRHPGGSEILDRWDVVWFSEGPEGAHGVRNDGEETARALMFSNVAYPAVTIYPDSDKIGVWTGDKGDDLIAPRSSGVDYYAGEKGSG